MCRPKNCFWLKKLSRQIEAYRQPSAVARAARQLQAQGKLRRPGQCVRFWYVYEENGVQAWDSGRLPQPGELDTRRYRELLYRAVATILQPFGISEKRLRQEIAAGFPFRPLSLWNLSDQRGCTATRHHPDALSVSASSPTALEQSGD